jgi:hypothetical protein
MICLGVKTSLRCQTPNDKWILDTLTPNPSPYQLTQHPTAESTLLFLA